MTIDGHEFFNLYDAEEKAEFTVEEIGMVMMQPVCVELVHIDTGEFVRVDTVYLVLVSLLDGRETATMPITDERVAIAICETLATRCKRFHGIE